jgi:hypothetical protein
METIFASNGEAITLNSEGYFVDDLGRYGYSTRLAGNYVCYTDGHMCECREED